MTKRKKPAEPRPQTIEYVKKLFKGTASYEEFLKISPITNTVGGIKKTLTEVRNAIKFIGWRAAESLNHD